MGCQTHTQPIEGVRVYQSPIGNIHWYLHKSRLVSVASVRYIKIWEVGKALSRMAIRLSQKKPFDIIEGGPPSAWLYPELRKLKNTEIVMTLHGSKGLHHHEFPGRLSIFDRFWCFAEMKAAQAADLLVAPSQYVANFYHQEYQRSPVVLALPAEQVRRKDSPASPVKILTLAAISPGKGSEIILEASKVLLGKYPDIQLSLVAAEGKPEFERLWHTCSPGQIKILPWLPPEKYIDQLIDSHLFLSASLFETFGLSVAEAMACGKVILASDIPAHKELVGESERGLAF